MLIKGLLLALCILRWNLEHFAHLHWRTCTKPVKYQNTNSWFWNCSESVVFLVFFSLSQNLDHLQQLDNLEHSAHLYGQFTTFELLTIFGPFTTFGQFTTFGLLTIFGSFTIFGQFTTFELVTPFGSLQYLDNV